ncbi:hypothetical protein ABE073_02785 [Lederbergia citrisecunda]|uniref:hypothetical protein n=1 Tax=Lederbergia citrisecunda TaxID=2833583 RepID=UPI003D2B1536
MNITQEKNYDTGTIICIAPSKYADALFWAVIYEGESIDKIASAYESWLEGNDATKHIRDIVVTTNGKTHGVSAKPWSGVITPAPVPNPDVKPQPKPEPDLGSGLYVIPSAPQSFANCKKM